MELFNKVIETANIKVSLWIVAVIVIGAVVFI